MALLFVDGFDAGDFAQKYTLGSAAGLSTTASTRFGSGLGLQKTAGNAGVVTKTLPASAGIILGFAGLYNINYSGYPAVFASVRTDSSATGQIQIATADTSGFIEVSKGFAASRTVLFTVPVSVGTWHYFELRVKIDPTAGYATLRVDGVELGTFTGNTKYGGTSNSIDGVQLFGASSGTGINLAWDDLYIIDETGSAPYNTFLGDIRINTIVPNGAGSSTGFTPSSGTNYSTVDELPYSAGDYVTATASGTRDLYGMSDVSGNYTVMAVQNNVIAKKVDAGGAALKPAIKSGATTYYGASAVLTSTDKTISDLRTNNPATAVSWTVSDVNAIEAGMEIV